MIPEPLYVGRFSKVFKCRSLTPEELRARGTPAAVATIAHFIVTAGSLWPGYPIYRAWFVSVITLADIPGVVSASKTSPEMTHEIILAAADPNLDFDPRPDMPETWKPFVYKVAEQFVATDDGQAAQIAEACAKAVSDGVLPAVDVGDDGRQAWANSIAKTLEHLNTGGHGKPN